MENAGIFYGHLEYLTVIWYILWPFGNFVVIWHIFPRFGKLCREKSGNPVCKNDYFFHARLQTGVDQFNGLAARPF
jgi:hypothetical protein